MKIRPVGDEVIHADGRKGAQTDLTTLTIAFRNFVNASKKRGKKLHAAQTFFSRIPPPSA